jgi:putative ABC transport system permease protein
MANVPYYYILRNLWARKLTTLLTAGGMALVVFVFAAVLMLSEGLKATLVDTGSRDNVVIIRRGAETEVQSAIDRDQAALIETYPEVAVSPRGRPSVSREVVVLMVLPKRGSAKPSNVTLRGLSEIGLVLRPQVRIKAGRMFRPGTSEIVAGERIADGFDAGLGERLRFGGRHWTVVGIFEAGRSGFASEIWGDVEQFMQGFRRGAYSSVILRLDRRAHLDPLRARIASDQRLNLEAQPEADFYAEQSEIMVRFLNVLGTALSLTFSLGAVMGAMITMYASVAHRTAEIGTLRALGFQRPAILRAFLTESLCLALFGGALGLALASTLGAITVSTMNWQTFSELAFRFTMTFEIVAKALCFVLAMGLLGGSLPALRAARLGIVEALRAS